MIKIENDEVFIYLIQGDYSKASKNCDEITKKIQY